MGTRLGGSQFERRLGFRHQVFQFGPEFFLGLLIHAVNEQYTIEVVEFVLDNAGEQTAAAELDGHPFQVQRLHVHYIRAGDVGVDLREAQAAFRAGRRLADRLDFWIEQDQWENRKRVGVGKTWHV